MAWNALDPLGDPQERPAMGECARCGLELYGDEDTLCAECRTALRQYDARTATAMFEVVDEQLKKYLSDDLRNTVCNVLVREFPMEDV